MDGSRARVEDVGEDAFYCVDQDGFRRWASFSYVVKRSPRYLPARHPAKI